VITSLITIVMAPISGDRPPQREVGEQYAEFWGVKVHFRGLAGRLEPDSLHFLALKTGRAPSRAPRNALWHPLQGPRIRELADGRPRDGEFGPSSPPFLMSKTPSF
jgi:hypothetical protein